MGILMWENLYIVLLKGKDKQEKIDFLERYLEYDKFSLDASFSHSGGCLGIFLLVMNFISGEKYDKKKTNGEGDAYEC